jgi:hypothetical protein
MRPPKLHDRSLKKLIDDDGKALAAKYCPDWTGFSDPDDPGRGLIALGARLVELLAERVNRVPEKNLLAFLDLVGVERAPGMPAEAPVTFLLAARSEVGQLVPAGTQVATTQSEVADAQVFETRNAFFATPAQLVHTINVVPADDQYGILQPLALPPKPDDLADSAGTVEILSAKGAGLKVVEHALYLASTTLFARKEPTDVTLEFTVTNGNRAVFDDKFLVWQRFDAEKKEWQDIGNVSYPASGAADKALVKFAEFPGTGKSEVDGKQDAWIVGRLKAPPKEVPGLPSVGQLVGFIATPQVPISAPDAAFFNDTPIDLSKPVFPFGEQPRYGDAFHLASDKAFAPDVASVTTRFTLRPYTLADLQAIFAHVTSTADNTAITTKVAWQYLAAGNIWKTIGTFDHIFQVTAQAGKPIFTQQGEKDATLFGTIGGAATVDFSFAPPTDIAVGKVGDITSRWVRVMLLSQNPYGRDGFVTIDASNRPKAVGPTFVPPVTEKIELEYTYKTSSFELDRITTHNNFEFLKYQKPFFGAGKTLVPFVPLSAYAPNNAPGFLGDRPAIYFNFDRKFGNAFISLLVSFLEPQDTAHLAPETGNPHVVWEYLTGGFVWKPLDMQDGTADLTSSGIIAFQTPADSAPHVLFPLLTGGQPLYWYRARLQSGTYMTPPRLKAVLLNSVMADNQETIRSDWVLASGSGEPDQQATILRRPVLTGEVWVRENEVPSEAEGLALLEELKVRAIEEGTESQPSLADVVVERTVPGLEGREVWVRWLRVPNFLTSGPRSRHYTLEAASGAVSFGDGRRGLIPPIGKDNIVVRGLRSGGGETANQIAAALAIKELKTSLPFIDKVFNVRGAVGGANPWSLDQTFDLGPQAIKNRGRAVTNEDYAWITLANFSQVARVKCLATRAPATGGSLVFKPGAVSVIIVPKGGERTPQPTRGLLHKIEAFLRRRVLGGIADEIHALPPDYRPVQIAAKVHPKKPEEASLIERRVVQALEAFFHPLSGGEQGEGWPFGRSIYISEVFAVIERTEGVDHVVEASFVGQPTLTRIDIGENVLVASGTHQITIV